MAYYIIYYYNYVDNFYVIAWIILGILILSLQLTQIKEEEVEEEVLEEETCDFEMAEEDSETDVTDVVVCFPVFLDGKIQNFYFYHKTTQDMAKTTSKREFMDKINPSHPLEPPSSLYWFRRYTDFASHGQLLRVLFIHYHPYCILYAYIY